MSHDSCYSHEVSEDIHEVVQTAVAYFKRRRVPGDPHEMRQEAYTIALTACANYPSKAESKGYLFCAVRKGLGNWLSKQLSILTIKDNFHKARDHQAVEVEKLPEQVVHVTPEVLHQEKERRAHTMGWRIRFRRALDSAMRGFTDEQRTIVDRIFGLDGLPSESPQSVAHALGVPTKLVYVTRTRLMKRVSEDIRFKILCMELDDLEGDDDL